MTGTTWCYMAFSGVAEIQKIAHFLDVGIFSAEPRWIEDSFQVRQVCLSYANVAKWSMKVCWTLGSGIILTMKKEWRIFCFFVCLRRLPTSVCCAMQSHFDASSILMFNSDVRTECCFPKKHMFEVFLVSFPRRALASRLSRRFGNS